MKKIDKIETFPSATTEYTLILKRTSLDFLFSILNAQRWFWNDCEISLMNKVFWRSKFEEKQLNFFVQISGLCMFVIIYWKKIFFNKDKFPSFNELFGPLTQWLVRLLSCNNYSNEKEQNRTSSPFCRFSNLDVNQILCLIWKDSA